MTDAAITVTDLRHWRTEVLKDVAAAEYDLAKWRAMLAWIDAEILNLEEEHGTDPRSIP